MFQFPGFALKTLCIQVISPCFSKLLICMANNNELSGGLPHSEILGSKPILGSPKLIAEYHVLHRLLLPRHPPNALLALDLIQKETEYCHGPRWFVWSALSGSKAYFPALACGEDLKVSGSRSTRSKNQPTVLLRKFSGGLVYLTWTTHVRFTRDIKDMVAKPVFNLPLARNPERCAKHYGHQTWLNLYLSIRCHTACLAAAAICPIGRQSTSPVLDGQIGGVVGGSRRT